MTASVRTMSVTNASAYALTEAVITQGQDYGIKVITRTIVASDVGADAGETGNLATGALCFQPTGSVVKAILGCSAFEANSGAMLVMTTIRPVLRVNGDVGIYDSSVAQAALPAGSVVHITILVGPA
jgi:hypothetical protein